MANMRIIIGDNDSKFIASASNILNQMGYSVVDTDTSGTGLLRKIRSLIPDIVIVDVNLKGMAGFEISSIVEGEGICPCIITFKNNPSEYQMKLEQKIVYAYIQKPIDKEVIDNIIEHAYTSFKKARDLERRGKERKIIDKAKLMLMRRYNMDEKKSYEYIRKKSMDRGTSMYKIALTIIDIINKKEIEKTNK